MPQEIQDQIYRLVLAELVHVQYDNVSHRPVHHNYRSPLSEKESYEAFMSSSTGIGTARSGSSNGWVCSPDGSRPFGLLRVNHRICKAVQSTMALELTTFSFSRPESIVQFINRLPGTLTSLVRKIQLDMTMGTGPDIDAWERTIAYLLPRFVNVRHVYLCIRLHTAMWWMGRYATSDTVEELDWMRPVVALAELSLWSATAIVTKLPALELSHIANSPYQAPYSSHYYYGMPWQIMGAIAHQPGLSPRDQHTVSKDLAGYIRKKLLRVDQIS